MNIPVDMSSCDQCIAPYQVSVFHPGHGDEMILRGDAMVLRFCGHHFEQVRDALTCKGWLVTRGSAADQLAAAQA